MTSPQEASLQQPLRILIVEDSPDDAELIHRALRKQGFTVHWVRVEDHTGVAQALTNETWDAVLTDHSMPSLASTDVITLVKSLDLTIPCLVVSGAIGEETAVSLMHLGATDYINKDNLNRLGPALVRALREATLTKRWRLAQEERELERQRLRAVLDVLPIAVFIADADGQLVNVNPAARALWEGQIPLVHLSQFGVFKGWDSESGERLTSDSWGIARALRGETVLDQELSIETFEGGSKTILNYAHPVQDPDGNNFGSVSVSVDITERKQAEENRRKLDLERALADQLAEERRRIGRDLHDGIRQQLVGIQMLASTLHRQLKHENPAQAEMMEGFSKLVRDANAEVRSLITGLVPPKIEAAHLLSSLERTASNIEQWFGIPCRLSARGKVNLQNDEVANHLYFIVTEALMNAARHSNASELLLKVIARGDRVTFQVCDDGEGIKRGFDARGGLGVKNMRYRAELIGASLTIKRRRQGGTMVSCQVINANPVLM